MIKQIHLMKIFILLIYLIPSIALGFQKQELQYEFVLNGTVQYDSVVNKKIVLGTMTGEVRDTTILTNNNFTFKGTIREASNAVLFINDKKIRFELTNDKIKMTITDIKKREYTIEYEKSSIKENIDSYFKVDGEVYSDKYKELIAKGLNAKNDKEKMFIEKQKDSLITKFIDDCIAKYKNLKDKDGYHLIVYDLTGFFGTRNYPEKIEQFYKLLPTELQNGFYGNKIQAYLDQSYKIGFGQKIDFKFSDINNKEKSLSEYKGKLVLLEFWATWCGPCVALLPELRKIHKSDKIEIVSISIDEDIEKWKNKVPKLGMTWINVHFKQKEDLKEKFFVNGVPYNILLSQDGEVLRKNVTIAELEQIVK